MSEWKYWTGNKDLVKGNTWYLGIYKDLSGSIDFIKIKGIFYHRDGDEMNTYSIDDSLGYFIEKPIQ